MPNPTEEKAIELAIQYLQKQGYEVRNVAKGKRRNSEHNGYDLVAQKAGEPAIKIEVKGCTRPWGIPDPYETEFKEGRLVADFLYVVYFLKDEAPKLCIIPRDAFKSEHLTTKTTYRISSRFENRTSLSRYLIDS